MGDNKSKGKKNFLKKEAERLVFCFFTLHYSPNSELIDDQFSTEEKDLDEHQKKKYKNFRTQFDNPNKKLHKSLRKDTEIMVINNSKETEKN